MHLDVETIVAALLHDTLEDTLTTPQEIRRNFGVKILQLVEAVTKLSNVKIKRSWFTLRKARVQPVESYERQIETLRKMLIAMSADSRVILIKLSDKIHNLETLRYLPPEKRERIAQEVIEIYAPIAQRLGMGVWKGILEDLAFPYVYPEQYKDLQKLAIPKIKFREKYLSRIARKLNKILKDNKIEAEVDFRAKRWFSLYKKLQKYENDLTKIYDLIAIRVVVDNIEQCYSVLGIIHSQWKPLPGRIKDYIALPKTNGYQSIHTTVFCDDGQIVEFQVRTKYMHQQAEFGIASHWIYSENKSSRLPQKDELQWIRDFYHNQKNINSADDLSLLFKIDLFQDRIFALTPQGDVKDLPYGATPIDFAYSIHSGVGNKCSGALINGKIAPLDTKLQNGDIVEILKRSNAKPHADWLKMVKTAQARNQIRRTLG
jgi:GTP pyrophosphokinase